MLENLEKNDVEGWCSLATIELRMLLARGQVYQARRFVSLLQLAAEAELPIEAYERREINQLINAIDAVQAGRHFLALHQLAQVEGSEKPLVRWAALMWRARAQVGEGELTAASETAEDAVARGEALGIDALCWASCVAAEVQARIGKAERAEIRLLRVLSRFIGRGEIRGTSLAHHTLAVVHHLTGATEESEAAADLAYNADGSWTGPPLWLARLALQRDDPERAESLLSSIPNPATDAYNLTLALKLAGARGIPLTALSRNLDLTDIPGEEALAGLRSLLAEQPDFWPGRETLAWKLLSLGQVADARAQLLKMEQADADRQSIAAVRLGLQVLKEQQESKSKAAELPKLQVESPSQRMRQGAFVGQISLFGVPELLQFLCSSRRSGTLKFSSQIGDARIGMHEGALLWAESPNNPSVGQYLAGKEAITPELADRLDHGMEIGHLFKQEGASSDKLRDALQQLLHATVKELILEWEDGWFEFDRSEDSDTPPQELQFSSQGVLLDVMREVDEENR